MSSATSKSDDRKAKPYSLLAVIIDPPFHLLLDVDWDAETPQSPTYICFELSDSASSESEESESSEDDDDAQYISIPAGSPFYTPPLPPTFQIEFDLLAVPKPPPAPLTLHATEAKGCESEYADDGVQYISIPAGSKFHTLPPPAAFPSAFDISPVGHIPCVRVAMVSPPARRCRSSLSPSPLLSWKGAMGRRLSLHTALSLQRINFLLSQTASSPHHCSAVLIQQRLP